MDNDKGSAIRWKHNRTASGMGWAHTRHLLILLLSFGFPLIIIIPRNFYKTNLNCSN